MTPPSSASVSFVDRLRWRAAQHPDRLAFRFLASGDDEDMDLNYGAVDTRAQEFGALLQGRGRAGSRAILWFTPGLDFITTFLGCLYAGVVPVPIYPVHPARIAFSLPWLEALFRQVDPAFVLSDSRTRDVATGPLGSHPLFRTPQWIVPAEEVVTDSGTWSRPEASPTDLAFLQFTSGSTGSARGVMIGHGNLMQNLEAIHRSFGTGEDSRGVFWLPFYHDMGLIGGILQSLYCGASTALMPPLTFLQRPLRWLQAVSDFRGTISGGPDFAYELCVRKTTPDERAHLDLRSWRLAFSGAEPVRIGTLQRFAEAFAPCGFRPEVFYPSYGLAECTLMVSGGYTTSPLASIDATTIDDRPLSDSPNPGGPSKGRHVSCGRPVPGQIVVIVDPQTCAVCPDGHIGEIWTAGGSVALGYWRQPEDTAQTFEARTQDGSGPYLRTGDLGFLLDGELHVTGRLKDLIIIHGRNHPPEDIEHTVARSHPSLRPGGVSAFSVELEDRECLIILAEIERSARPRAGVSPQAGAAVRKEDVLKQIRQAVAQAHDLQVHEAILVKPGAIPRTSSGKIKRHACRDAFTARALEALEV